MDAAWKKNKKTSNAYAAFFQNNPVQRMREFIALLTKEKAKTPVNEWGNDDWHSLSFIHCT